MTRAHELETIGALVVRDETGTTHRVTIRREDLTTTNEGYRAIRDTIDDTLRLVLRINRDTPREQRADHPDVPGRRCPDRLRWASR